MGDLVKRADDAPDGMFLIENRGLYYRPDASGYTGIKDEAGRYSFSDAAIHAGPNGPDGSQDGITIWAEADAPDYSPACYSDIKERHMRDKLTAALKAAEARIAELEAALRWYHDQMCEGMCKDLPHNSTYTPEMDDVCAGCKARAALGETAPAPPAKRILVMEGSGAQAMAAALNAMKKGEQR